MCAQNRLDPIEPPTDRTNQPTDRLLANQRGFLDRVHSIAPPVDSTRLARVRRVSSYPFATVLFSLLLIFFFLFLFFFVLREELWRARIFTARAARDSRYKNNRRIGGAGLGGREAGGGWLCAGGA